MEETEEDALQESNRVISCSEITGYRVRLSFHKSQRFERSPELMRDVNRWKRQRRMHCKSQIGSHRVRKGRNISSGHHSISSRGSSEIRSR